MVECGGCWSIFFILQSKTCQKADWKEGHKLICRSASNLRDIRERYGEEIELKHKSFEAWCTETGSFSHAAISALGLHSDWKRIGAPAFSTPILFFLTHKLDTRQLRFPRWGGNDHHCIQVAICRWWSKRQIEAQVYACHHFSQVRLNGRNACLDGLAISWHRRHYHRTKFGSSPRINAHIFYQ